MLICGGGVVVFPWEAVRIHNKPVPDTWQTDALGNGSLVGNSSDLFVFSIRYEMIARVTSKWLIYV